MTDKTMNKAVLMCIDIETGKIRTKELDEQFDSSEVVEYVAKKFGVHERDLNDAWLDYIDNSL